MQLDPQIFLRLAEKAGTLACFDLECTGLRSDYNSVLVGSIKPYGQKVTTFTVKQPGNDQKVVREIKEYLETFDVICGYYSKGFDAPFLNTRLLKWNQPPVKKLLHIDMYYMLKYNLLTARRSQGHLLSFLETPENKMSVGANYWNEVLYNPKAMEKMVDRCESDVIGLEQLYTRTRHLIADIKR